MSPEQRVRIEVSDHIAVVTLSRGDKHNALDLAMFEAIIGAAERVATEPGVRADHHQRRQFRQFRRERVRPESRLQ